MGGRMLITGATGFIGGRLASRASDHGWRVRTLARRTWTGAPLVPLSERFWATLPGRIPDAALADVDTVVHCAVALTERPGWDRAVNVEATVRLAQQAAAAGARAFVFLSTLSSKRDAPSVYGQTKFEAEQALAEVKGIAKVILRPGLVTGPGARGVFQEMTKIVDSAPAVPLLGGGRARVQPIHVDDLCDAIEAAARDAERLDGEILSLGDPRGIELKDLLRKLSLQRKGRPGRMFSIPLGPIEAAVKAVEAVGLPSPISSGRVKGLRGVELTPTQESLDRLGIELRSIDEAIRNQAFASREPLPAYERPARILLVGAGRIGAVHALTMARQHGGVLVGIVDPDPSSATRIAGFGIDLPRYDSLEAAPASSVDAVIIATPPAAHAALVRACVERGWAVLVEKPVAANREDLEALAAEVKQRLDARVQVGYVVTRYPHVTSTLARLRAGAYGRVRSFSAFTLVTLVDRGGQDRWEVRPEDSGGGVLMNAGGHTLSMIIQAFGPPRGVRAQTTTLVSDEVEDSAIVDLDYGGFSGTLFASWSIEGFGRQENRLVVDTELGRLILSGAQAVFLPRHGDVEVKHQLDADVGFNMAPDYSGAGFSLELADLARAAREGVPAPMGMDDGAAVDRAIFAAYDVAREVNSLSCPLPAPRASSRLPTPVKRGAGWVVDARELSAADLGVLPSREWDAYVVFPEQLGGLLDTGVPSHRVRVTVPDFMSQGRLLASGQVTKVATSMGPLGLAAAATRAARLLPKEQGATFWVAAVGLTAGAVESTPRDFDGTLLVHPYLIDFALTMQRLDVVEALVASCRALRPRARVGFHTNLAAEAVNAIRWLESPVDDISLLASPHARHIDDDVALLRAHGGPALRITAEVGPGPAPLHRWALSRSERWLHGADFLQVGLQAEPAYADARTRRAERAWRRAFPGTSMPAEVL